MANSNKDKGPFSLILFYSLSDQKLWFGKFQTRMHVKTENEIHEIWDIMVIKKFCWRGGKTSSAIP